MPSRPAMESPTATRWSLILAAGSDAAAGREALAWLCRRYWDPLRAHIRRRGWRDDEDAVQDFLVDLIERGAIAGVDRGRGRFRAWLYACLDHFLANRAAAAQAQKRGGGRHHGQIGDDAAAEARPAGDDPAFDRDWAMTILGHAQDRLAAEQDDRRRWTELSPFLSRNGDGAEYRAVGARLGLGEGAVKVAVHRLRARLRELVRAGIADTLASDETGLIDAELDHLIAALAGAA